MDVASSSSSRPSLSDPLLSKDLASSKRAQKAAVDTVLLEGLNKPTHNKRAERNQELSDNLYFTAQKVLARLNDFLAEKVPGGIESLNPEDLTPEKTADQIVTQVTAFFESYAKSNPNKSPEELVSGFMKAARKGIEQGYDEAFDILEGFGAFEIPGVKEGIEKTKALIEDKLRQFESQLNERYGLNTTDQQDHSKQQDPLLADQTGNLLDLVA